MAETKWIWLSLLFGVLSHASRAYRWKYLLEPLGFKVNFPNRFMAVMVAYFANLGIPRSGEILRGATIATYDDVPFEKAFGTIISERVADFLMLLIVVTIALVYQSEILWEYMLTKNINPFITAGILLVGVTLLAIFLRFVQRSQHALALKVRTFATGLLEGMRSIFSMRHKTAFVLHTIFIWGMYVLMFWVIKFTIPEMVSVPLGIILAAFVIGSFSISVTNGGIGVYPIAIGALFVFFGISKESGEAFGWIIWGAQTLLVIVLGAFSFLLLPFFNKIK